MARIDPAHPPHRVALGNFLRSRRERLDPIDSGFARTGVRRTPGLRREDVAEAVGITADWYARLEQGRVAPSERTIHELARVLRLEPDEREHLWQLVRNVRRIPYVCKGVPPVLRDIVRAMNQPAYVTCRRWDVLVWNDAASDLFMNFDAAAPADRNVLVYMMLDRNARALYGSTWRSEARRIIAHFRIDYDIWFGDAAFLDLERRLLAGSPEFADLWREHEVRRPAASFKDLSHRIRGRLNVEYASFRSTENADLRLVVHSLVPKARGGPTYAIRGDASAAALDRRPRTGA